jgi:hypothetical protein
MVRSPDRPLRIVRVSFETTRFSAEHLIDAYASVVPIVQRAPRAMPRGAIGPPQVKTRTAKRRRGEA